MYILTFTFPSQPKPFITVVDKLVNLAGAVDKIKKRGQNATIKIYEATPKNYVLTYRNQSRTVTDKIPEITLT